MKKEVFNECFERLQFAFEKIKSGTTAKIYYEELVKMPDFVFKSIIKKIIKEETFFPSIAKFFEIEKRETIYQVEKNWTQTKKEENEQVSNLIYRKTEGKRRARDLIQAISKGPKALNRLAEEYDADLERTNKKKFSKLKGVTT